MSSPTKVPLIPGDLITWLEKQYPDRVPMNPATTTEDLRILQGQQGVVQNLRRHFDNQNTTILNR